ncbi:MAG TPA: hypothetical protein VKT82_00445 [Ktedonobacterales bacterium]|nr:hypothetical protein [Ktedonobacterales bacterium]
MLTTNFSSSSVVSTILFGMLFAWLLVTAVMTYMTGVRQPSAITRAAENNPGAPRPEATQRAAEAPPEQVATPATASAPVVDEAVGLPMEESAPFPLTRGRRATQQHVGPETASIAASADSR